MFWCNLNLTRRSRRGKCLFSAVSTFQRSLLFFFLFRESLVAPSSAALGAIPLLLTQEQWRLAVADSRVESKPFFPSASHVSQSQAFCNVPYLFLLERHCSIQQGLFLSRACRICCIQSEKVLLSFLISHHRSPLYTVTGSAENVCGVSWKKIISLMEERALSTFLYN